MQFVHLFCSQYTNLYFLSFFFGNNLHSQYFGLTQLQCFSLGAEVGPHKKDHKYRIMVSAIFDINNALQDLLHSSESIYICNLCFLFQ